MVIDGFVIFGMPYSSDVFLVRPLQSFLLVTIVWGLSFYFYIELCCIFCILYPLWFM
jgi:hypothetical protein